MKTLAIGLFLTAVVTTLAVIIWGREGLAGAAVFGALALGIQILAVATLKKGWDSEFEETVKKFGIGMALRLGGIVAFAIGVSLWPELFAPLPSALGFLGVLVPLLFLELKLIK